MGKNNIVCQFACHLQTVIKIMELICFAIDIIQHCSLVSLMSDFVLVHHLQYSYGRLISKRQEYQHF